MTLNVSIHNNKLLAILKDIYGDSTISSYLGFKGGTAAYLFYGLERFSVDLDFDLLDETKEDYIFEKIENIVKHYGKIKESRKNSYEDAAHNIKSRDKSPVVRFSI